MSSKVRLEAAVLLNDVHLELEDADHDVTHVIHAVSPPQLQGRDEKTEDEQSKTPELEEADGRKDEVVELDVGEVADEVEYVRGTGGEDNLVKEDVEVMGEVVYLDIDNVGSKSDLEDVDLYSVDDEQDALLDIELDVQNVVNVGCEGVVVE